MDVDEVRRFVSEEAGVPLGKFLCPVSGQMGFLRQENSIQNHFDLQILTITLLTRNGSCACILLGQFDEFAFHESQLSDDEREKINRKYSFVYC